MKLPSLFKTPRIKGYWWRKVPNFGDALAPFLLERFADIRTLEWSTVSHASIASIGSILEHIPPDWDGYIVGSGKLIENARLSGFGTTAKILALRGPLTARGFRGNFGLGDPGILANELVGHQEKKWDLGIVPHWQDTNLADRFTKLIPTEFTCKVINTSDNPINVVRDIGSCRRIVTSSLHGAVVADAFGGIPRRIEICDGLSRDGGLFKFQDYSASIRTPFEIGKMIEPSRFHVEDIKFSIYDAYRELSREIGKGNY
jgi:pyruvyltransferase